MPLVRTGIRGFPRGLVTDTSGVEGALLVANDVVVIRNNELRKRGGKEFVVDASNQVTPTNSFAHYIHPTIGALAAFGNGPIRDMNLVSEYGFSARALGSTAWSASLIAANNSNSKALGVGTVGCPPRLIPFGDELIGFYNKEADDGNCLRWGGGTAAKYQAGTVSGTAGDTFITGSGTLWMANLTVGSYILVLASQDQIYRITSVDSDTQVSIDRPITTTFAAGTSYSTSAFVPVETVNTDINTSGSTSLCAFAWEGHQGRLFGGGMADEAGATNALVFKHRIRWSGVFGEPDPDNTDSVGIENWQTRAAIDVDPSIGTEIRGLASYANSLLIMKDLGVFLLTGVVATDGSDTGATIQVVSDELGISGVNAYVATEGGVVFADERGCYLWNGNSVASLTQGRIGQQWLDTFSGVEQTVSEVDGRIIVQSHDPDYADGTPDTFVYDIRRDLWTTQTTSEYGRIQKEYSSGAVAFEYALRSVGGGMHDWRADYRQVDKDDPDGSGPRMEIATHPIVIGQGAADAARATHVFFEGFIEDAAADDPTLDVTIDSSKRQGGVFGSEPVITVGSVADSSVAKTHRLKIQESHIANSSIVRIKQNGPAIDGALYGLDVQARTSGRYG